MAFSVSRCINTAFDTRQDGVNAMCPIAHLMKNFRSMSDNIETVS